MVDACWAPGLAHHGARLGAVTAFADQRQRPVRVVPPARIVTVSSDSYRTTNAPSTARDGRFRPPPRRTLASGAPPRRPARPRAVARLDHPRSRAAPREPGLSRSHSRRVRRTPRAFLGPGGSAPASRYIATETPQPPCDANRRAAPTERRMGPFLAPPAASALYRSTRAGRPVWTRAVTVAAERPGCRNRRIHPWMFHAATDFVAVSVTPTHPGGVGPSKARAPRPRPRTPLPPPLHVRPVSPRAEGRPLVRDSPKLFARLGVPDCSGDELA